MATELRVSMWEYSAIRKNAADKTEAEFIGWMLEKWPFLREHLYEEIKVVVDQGNGDLTVWDAIQQSPIYILSIQSRK